MPVTDDRVLLLSVERELERLGDAVTQNTEDIAGDATILAGLDGSVEGLRAQVEDLERRLAEAERRLDATIAAADAAAEMIETLEKMLLSILAHLKARRS